MNCSHHEFIESSVPSVIPRALWRSVRSTRLPHKRLSDKMISEFIRKNAEFAASNKFSICISFIFIEFFHAAFHSLWFFEPVDSDNSSPRYPFMWSKFREHRSSSCCDTSFFRGVKWMTHNFLIRITYFAKRIQAHISTSSLFMCLAQMIQVSNISRYFWHSQYKQNDWNFNVLIQFFICVLRVCLLLPTTNFTRTIHLFIHSNLTISVQLRHKTFCARYFDVWQTFTISKTFQNVY